MKRLALLPLIAAVALLPFAAHAQTTTPTPTADERKATEIGLNIRRLFLLNQLLPVLMNREQVREILKIVESARSAERAQAASELKFMREVEAEVKKALKDAEEKGKIPSDSLMKKLLTLQTLFTRTRGEFIEIQVSSVTGQVMKILDKGQQAAAANALDPRAFDPRVDVTKLTQEDRMRVWVRYVLLDPQAYQILSDLSKNMKAGQILGTPPPKEDR